MPHRVINEEKSNWHHQINTFYWAKITHSEERELKNYVPDIWISELISDHPFSHLRTSIEKFLERIGCKPDHPIINCEVGILLDKALMSGEEPAFHTCIWMPTNPNPKSPEEGGGFGFYLPADSAKIKWVEETFGSFLLREYLDLLLISNGVRKMFWPLNEGIVSTDEFKNNSEELNKWLEAYEEVYSENDRKFIQELIIIINDGFGNQYCVASDGTVAMLEHEEGRVIRNVFPNVGTLLKEYFSNMNYLLYDPY